MVSTLLGIICTHEYRVAKVVSNDAGASEGAGTNKVQGGTERNPAGEAGSRCGV